MMLNSALAPKMGSYRAKTSGFTLIELMVAVSITAVIGVIAATILSTMLANHKQVLHEEKSLLALERALQIMRSDIEHLAIRPLIKSINQDENYVPSTDQNQIIGDESRLEFSIYSQQPSSVEIEQSLNRVRYQLIDGALTRESIGTDYPSPNQEWRSDILLYEVTELNFSYFYDRWENSLLNDKKYPAAVRISLNTKRWQAFDLIGKMSGVDQ
ncbi:MAG: prepilin-type N-terminal cleavage/methylation domain-containing protein [Oceanospirillaceae bacterium]|nr:prepilin-type N-terminal cleavage/methylation domain-containing protein [Oceanospirillaceae bacterium]